MTETTLIAPSPQQVTLRRLYPGKRLEVSIYYRNNCCYLVSNLRITNLFLGHISMAF